MPDKLLAGMRGVVTGVANDRSIAWGCAKACAEQGAALAFSFLGEAPEKRVKALLQDLPDALCIPCDVTKDEEIGSFFGEIGSEWGEIDFLIHSVA